MSSYLPNFFKAYLAAALPAGATVGTIVLDRITTLTGETIETADLTALSRGIITVNPDGDGLTSYPETISFAGIDPTTKSLTGSLRGVDKDGAENTDYMRYHPVGTPVIVSFNTQNISDLIDYLNSLVVATRSVIVPGNAGVAVTAGNLIYFSSSDTWLLCDADDPTTVENVLMGIAQGTTVGAGQIPTGVLILGKDIKNAGLTPGTKYYASNTPGGISITPGTKEVSIGWGTQDGFLYFEPRFDQQLTEDQQDALVGSSGTPSAANLYITQADVSAAGVADKIVRAVGNKLPALDASLLTNFSLNLPSVAGEAFTGATTPQPATIINDIFQQTSGGSVTIAAGKVTTGNKAAIKIIPQGAVTLTQLKVLLKKQGSPTDNMVVTIETDNAGAPSGTPLTNGTATGIAGGGLTTSFVNTTITFPGTVTLVPNITYWIVFKRDSTTSDTNYYLFDGDVAANAYGAYTGSTFNASAWSTGADIPYFQILTVTGSSSSIWRSDANHGSYYMRFVAGMINQTVAKGAAITLFTNYVLGGFTGLTLGSTYYNQDAVGTIGLTPGTTEAQVGVAISATQLLINTAPGRPQFLASFSAAASIPVPPNGRMAVASLSASCANPMSIVADLTIYKVGKTSGQASNGATNSGGGAAAQIEVDASWSGNTIACSAAGSGNTGTVNAVGGTVYIYY